jgi:hypothetical protein
MIEYERIIYGVHGVKCSSSPMFQCSMVRVALHRSDYVGS